MASREAGFYGAGCPVGLKWGWGWVGTPRLGQMGPVLRDPSGGWGGAPRPQSWPGLGVAAASSPAEPRLVRKQPHLGSLSPFLLTCTAYFLLWIPEDPPSWVGALVKCLPVLSLVGLLRANPGPGPGSRSYSLRLQAALLFSALGDAFLIWPDLFLHGEWGSGRPVPLRPPRAPVQGRLPGGLCREPGRAQAWGPAVTSTPLA